MLENAPIYLFFSMLILALMPSVSSILVFTRASEFGFKHGLATIAGITIVDLLFILIALYSVSFLAQKNAQFFIAVSMIAALYLFYLSTQIWRSQSEPAASIKAESSSYWGSFLSGFLITIADQKVLFFYFGFMPAFITENKVAAGQTLLILISAVSALMIAKLPYAFGAVKLTASLAQTHKMRVIKKISASILFIAALALCMRSAYLILET